MAVLGRIIKASGTILPFYTDRSFAKLEDAQRVARGHIQVVRIKAPFRLDLNSFNEDCFMLINKEGVETLYPSSGSPKELPHNRKASKLAKTNVMGDVLIIPVRLWK